MTLAAAGALAAASPAVAATITSGPPSLSNQDPTIAWTADTVGGTFSWKLVNTGTGTTVAAGGGEATSAGPIAVGSGTYRFDVDETPPVTDPPTTAPPTASVAFAVDKTPPTIRRDFVVAGTGNVVTPNDAGWFRQEVVARYACGAGATSCPADEGPFRHPTESVAIAAQTVSDAAGNTATVPATTVSVDTQPPAMYFGTPLPGGALDGTAGWIWTGSALQPGTGSPAIQLGPGSAFSFTPGCAIDRETSGLVTCVVTMKVGSGAASALTPQRGSTPGAAVTDAIPMTRDASQLGARVIAYAGSDVAGNTNTKTVRYTVVDNIAPAKPMPTTPTDTVNSRRPSFSWPRAAETGSGMRRYEVWIDNAKAFEVNAVTESGTEPAEYSTAPPAAVASLATGQHTWQLRAVDGAGNTSRSDTVPFSVDTTAPDPPQVSGPTGLVATRTPVFQALGLPGAAFGWILDGVAADGSTSPVQSGGPAASGTIAPAPLDDGAYRLRVRQTSTLGTAGQFAIVPFTVDATPPPAPAGVTAVGVAGDAQPTFTWVAGEPGGAFRWQVLGPAGDTRLGPGTATAAPVRLPAALPAGAYTFRVRQSDAAGNLSAPADVAFSVAAAPAPAPAGPAPAPAAPPAVTTATRTTAAKLVVATINAVKSRPRAGTTVRTLAPRLSWPRYRGATVYNVQVYRMQGTRFVKVVSAFPRRNAYVVPAKKLKKGQRYLWRVWPYLGSRKRYTATAKAQSWFTVARTAKAPVRKPVARAKR